MKYQVLDWDSNFFGFKVASIIVTKTDEVELNKVLTLLKQQDVTLVYVSAKVTINHMDRLFQNYNGKMIDEKVTYIKDVNINLKKVKNSIKYELKYPTNQMIKLAIESGIYSRFNRDKRIGKDKYEELYKRWIINSVNHSIAKEVIVSKEKEAILGMVTLSEKNKRANVGIIAVDSKARGKGVGKTLMMAAEKWAAENSYDKIQVVTQGDNRPACGLYKKVGYSKEITEYYYHFWLKNRN